MFTVVQRGRDPLRHNCRPTRISTAKRTRTCDDVSARRLVTARPGSQRQNLPTTTSNITASMPTTARKIALIAAWVSSFHLDAI